MNKRQPSNIAASIHRRLLNCNRTLHEDFNYVLSRYAIERLLYRLYKSDHVDTFVLKGASLFLVWTGRTYRPTKDLDLLGYGDISVERLTSIFQQVCSADVEPDGLIFDAESICVSEIRHDQEYQGKRVELSSTFGKAVINLQIDIGFGDSIVPDAQEIIYPTLLDLPAPHIKAYPRETVIAEKFQAMVALGGVNSRLKDFADIYIMAKQFSFDGTILASAISSTFKRRQTPLPDDIPLALTDTFASLADKRMQWQGFLKRNRNTDLPFEFSEIIFVLRKFIMPLLSAIAAKEIFTKQWHSDSLWK
jgi:predicted nucleotidyltransferase component of viral defense system